MDRVMNMMRTYSSYAKLQRTLEYGKIRLLLISLSLLIEVTMPNSSRYMFLLPHTHPTIRSHSILRKGCIRICRTYLRHFQSLLCKEEHIHSTVPGEYPRHKHIRYRHRTALGDAQIAVHMCRQQGYWISQQLT